MPLEELVYAPLHALARSNIQLHSQLVEAVKSMGRMKQEGKEESLLLDNINIAYEQVRPETGEGCSVDNLQLQVPLLSIVPLTNLNVEKAQIDFSAEVKVEQQETGHYAITARVCSPEQRGSDFLPRVSYRLQIRSLPAAESILRLTDTLSANQVARKTDTTPVAVDGSLGGEEQKAMRQEISEMKNKIGKLRQLYQKISDMIAEQEKLRQLSRDTFEETAREFDKDKYLMAQTNIANRIMEYREKIMDKEIQFGLERDYQ